MALGLSVAGVLLLGLFPEPILGLAADFRRRPLLSP